MDVSGDIQMTSTKDAHHRHKISESQTKNPNIVKIIDSESTKHDKIHCQANAFQYLVLIVVGISYCIYGSLKLSESTAYPLQKSYEKTIDSYPVPTTIACISIHPSTPNETYFETKLDWFQYSQNSTSSPSKFEPCTMIDDESPSNQTTKELITNNDKCVLLEMYSTKYARQCFIFIPPKNITATDFTMQYIFWEDGYMDPDDSLLSIGISTPKFLTHQRDYTVFYSAFHLSQFIDEYQDHLDKVGWDYIGDSVIEWAEREFVYAFPFTISITELTLKKFKTLNGDEISSFDVIPHSLVTTLDVTLSKCGDAGEFNMCSFVSMNFRFRKSDQDGYLVKYTEQYSDYTFFDLLSGIGGIVSGAQGIVAQLSALLLMGFGCGCFEWKGIAPYPTFDDNFSERISRLLSK